MYWTNGDDEVEIAKVCADTFALSAQYNNFSSDSMYYDLNADDVQCLIKDLKDEISGLKKIKKSALKKLQPLANEAEDWGVFA